MQWSWILWFSVNVPHPSLDGEGSGGHVSPCLAETGAWSWVPFSNQGHGNLSPWSLSRNALEVRTRPQARQ